jgi:hypothetical protein
MKRALLTIAIVCTIAIAGSALAQTPNIAVYFDANYQVGSENCPAAPPLSVLDTLYVVGHNFNMWIGSCEFQIDYPPQMQIMGDIYDSDLQIGNTWSGIGLVWNPPKNGFVDALLCRVRFLWNCDDCQGTPGNGYPIQVNPHPDSGLLRAIRWPDLYEQTAVGMLSYICPQVPVEESSWGQIKALYH